MGMDPTDKCEGPAYSKWEWTHLKNKNKIEGQVYTKQ